MTQEPQHNALFAGPFIMFISAALFGYFGFMAGLSTTLNNQVVFLFAFLVWTLRLSAIGCLAAGLLTMMHVRLGNLVYSIVSVFSGIAFIIVGIMDLLDKQLATALPPILAFIFAAWNGYGGWQGIRIFLATRSAASNPFAPQDPA